MAAHIGALGSEDIEGKLWRLAHLKGLLPSIVNTSELSECSNHLHAECLPPNPYNGVSYVVIKKGGVALGQVKKNQHKQSR